VTQMENKSPARVTERDFCSYRIHTARMEGKLNLTERKNGCVFDFRATVGVVL
jgi:hypothetical protein